jgi:hypothetical protein
LQDVQEEAAELVSQLRSKMIAVPSASTMKRRGAEQRQQRQGQQQRRNVTFK